MLKNNYKNMRTHKALFISKLTLVLLLVYTVIKVALPLGDSDNGLNKIQAKNKGDVQATETAQLPGLSLEDYAQILKRDPFNSSSQTTGPDGRSSTAGSSYLDRSVSEELGLVLFGTISGSPSVARAIIKDLKTNVFNHYKIGQAVGNARIESIEVDAVILLHANERKRLCINAWQSENANNSRVIASTAGSKEGKTSTTNLPEESKATNTHTRSEQIEKALAKMIVKPYIVNGRTEGLKVTGLENVEFAAAIGVKNGDIIRSVNGHSLTSKQKAYQVFKKARTQPDITLDLLRNNKPKKLSFTLR